MKRLFCSSVILLVSMLARDSYGDFTGAGHVHTHSETRQIFLNPNCHTSDSCDLKRFTLTKLVNEIWFSDDRDHPTYSNGVIMEYETDSVSALEKYAIVQFKKGCVFETFQSPNGKIHRAITDTVASFGEQIPFCFRQWVIDSQDRDPAYNSDPDFGRFYLLRWNHPGSYDNRTQKYYGAEKPKRPIVYMADYPAGAFISRTSVRNVALEFNTCIFKSVDVPSHTSRTNLRFAKPITCFEWQDIYIYDYATARFQTDLTFLASWEESPTSVEPDRRLLPITLLLAIALISYFAWRRFR